MILAGDIGGTKTVLALFEDLGNDRLEQMRDAVYPSKDHQSFGDILTRFLKGDSGLSLKAACFGVAGAVIDGQVRTTNLPWQLDEKELAQAMGAPRVKLLNDLEAAAYGMLYLEPDELSTLNPGIQPRRKGNVAVIAAGTGLGEAMLYWDGERFHPLASEGGHADFAPRTDREIELLRYLRGKCGGHVSYERVLSGPGFYNIYTFLRDTGVFPEPLHLADQFKTGNPNVIITQMGMAGQDPLCAAAVEMFVSLYGAEAGNLALKCVAVGGVFVGGGIAPKMLAALETGPFLRSFFDKGRFDDLMKGMEVSVALNPRAPLLGAAHYALRV